jgi:hypothetical protein
VVGERRSRSSSWSRTSHLPRRSITTDSLDTSSGSLAENRRMQQFMHFKTMEIHYATWPCARSTLHVCERPGWLRPTPLSLYWYRTWTSPGYCQNYPHSQCFQQDINSDEPAEGILHGDPSAGRFSVQSAP